jgi:hypothetical protein
MYQLQATTTEPINTSAQDGFGPPDRVGKRPSRMQIPPSSKTHPAAQRPTCKDICLAIPAIIDELANR